MTSIDRTWTSGVLRDALGKVLNPGACAAVLEALEQPEANFASIAPALRSEPYLAARTLALANLASADRPIHSLERAVGVLGLRQVKALVFSSLLVAMMVGPSGDRRRRRDVWRWVLAMAVAGQWIVEQRRPLDQEAGADGQSSSLATGLLGAMGVLVLRAGLGQSYDAILGRPIRPLGLVQREEQQLAVNHHQISRWALRQMGCPAALWRHVDAAAEAEQGVDALTARTIEALGARIAGHQPGQAEAWLLDAMPRLGIDAVVMIDHADRMEKSLESLAGTLEIDLGDWQRGRHEPLMVSAGLAMESMLIDNVQMSRAMGDSTRQQAHFIADSETHRQQAATDPLTGLLNRHGWTQMLEEISTEPAHRVGLVLVDVDHFKQVNDRLGHAVGDHVLQILGKHLVSTEPSPLAVGRLGGDEFVLLVSAEDCSSLTQWCEKLRQSLQFEQLTTGEPPATISIGGLLTHSDRLHNTWDVLYRRVDQLMYQAKQSGRDRAVVG